MRWAFLGEPMSRWRAWPIAAVYAWTVAVQLSWLSEIPTLLEAARFLTSAALIAGLVARRPWARVVALGFLASSHVWVIHDFRFVVCAALLLPWRRNEITRTGAASIFVVAAWASLWWLLTLPDFPYSTKDDDLRVLWAISLACLMLGGAGMLLRARWAALAFGAGALVLAYAWPMPFQDHAIGACFALLAAAVLTWRAALPPLQRSTTIAI